MSHHLTLKRCLSTTSRFLSKSTQDVFIVEAARTPIGSFQGSLSSITAPKLGALSIQKVVEKSGIDKNNIDGVHMGCVLSAGMGQAPDRQAALYAGLPDSVPCTLVNKVCASGMKSVMIAADALALGHANLMIAGGMESMSNSPFYLSRSPLPYGGTKLVDSLLHDGLTDPYNAIHMGKCAEKTASELNISRADQDEFAIQSYERALKAYESGFMDDELFEIELKDRKNKVIGKLTRDEELSNYKGPAPFSTLRPAFDRDNGTITAANASLLSDGSAALLLANKEAVDKFGLKPKARIIGYSDGAVAPIDFAIAPKVSTDRLLSSTNTSMDSVDLWEINEAFSAVVIANIKLHGLNIDKVNVDGGAVSLGHPIGCSGARIVSHLLFALHRRKLKLGVASICNGGGGASSILIETIDS